MENLKRWKNYEFRTTLELAAVESIGITLRDIKLHGDLVNPFLCYSRKIILSYLKIFCSYI
jgi:hypothetical protein